jgi:N4-gp56 family major capsid protein
MSIASDLSKLTRTEILADEIQRALRKNSVAWALARDLSDRLRPGQRYTTIPRSVGRSVGNYDDSGTELADSATSYLKDTLQIDKFKTVWDYIYDTDQAYSSVDLVDDFYVEAAPAMAEQLEGDLIAAMVAAGTVKPESGGANTNKFQLAGTDDQSNANQRLTLNQLSLIGKEMDEAKIPKSGRICMVSPKQAHLLRTEDGIQDASKFGNNQAVVNGELARLYGFIIVESQDLTANQVVIFHTDAIVKAMMKNVTVDEERHSSKKRTFVSMDAQYGVRVIRDGELIWFGDETAAL